MNYSKEKMAELVTLLERHSPDNGINYTELPDFGTYRQTGIQARCAGVYEPVIIILAQGKKKLHMGEQTHDYSVGKYLTFFLPMPVEAEIIEASKDKPLLAACFKVDLVKIANLLMKIDRVKEPSTKAEKTTAFDMFTHSLNDELLDPVLKLFRTLDNPVERAILGESLLEEIYFRIICNDHSGSLRRLLQHRGEVQRISKVVDHIHRNLAQPVSVDELADMVNMSASGFRKTFRDVMHMPPLQYAKSIKLNRAQMLIREGKNASEAGYLVGYNSPAQFSREYKRHFGISPSKALEFSAT